MFRDNAGKEKKMTVKEAKELLKTAPNNDSPCHINKVLTTAHFFKIMTDCMNSHEEQFGEDYVLKDIFEKRIHQCVKNQKRPRYSNDP